MRVLPCCAPVAVMVTLLGCASGFSDGERLARELIVPYPSSQVASRPAEEIVLDRPAIEKMRQLAAKRGEILVAVLRLPQGYHPYLVVAFVQKEERIRVVATSMYWSDVMEKRLAVVVESDLQELLEMATATFDCSTGVTELSVLATVLVYWREGIPTTCDGGWGTEDSGALWPLIWPILESARTVYEDQRSALDGSPIGKEGLDALPTVLKGGLSLGLVQRS